MQNIQNLENTFSFKNKKAQYQIKIIYKNQNVSITIEDIKSSQKWKNSFNNSYIQDLTNKAGRKINISTLIQQLFSALKNKTEDKLVDIMSSFEIQNIKNKKMGNSMEQSNNKSNKQYIILSIKGAQKSYHYPLPLNFVEVENVDHLKEIIIKMKQELYELKKENNLQKSESLGMDATTQIQQMKSSNEVLKKQIKQMQQFLSQKQGAVELDIIIRQKMDLQLRVQGIRRQQGNQIAKLKSIYQNKQRQVNDMKNELNFILKQKQLKDQNNNNNQKLRGHILRIYRMNETELNNSKKVIQKQKKQIQNINKNILNCKNIQKKLLIKIKQIQIQLQQAKKKANTKQISNRLYSPASSKKSNISAPIKPNINNNNNNRYPKSITDQNSSAASKNSKPRSYNGYNNNNNIRQNLVKPSIGKSNSKQNLKNNYTNPLLKTTPILSRPSPNGRQPISSLTSKIPPRYNYTKNIPVVPQIKKQIMIKNNFQNNKYDNNKFGNRVDSRSNSKNSNDIKKNTTTYVSNQILKNNYKKQQSNQRNILKKIEEIKNKYSKNPTSQKTKNTSVIAQLNRFIKK